MINFFKLYFYFDFLIEDFDYWMQRPQVHLTQFEEISSFNYSSSLMFYPNKIKKKKFLYQVLEKKIDFSNETLIFHTI